MYDTFERYKNRYKAQRNWMCWDWKNLSRAFNVYIVGIECGNLEISSEWKKNIYGILHIRCKWAKYVTSDVDHIDQIVAFFNSKLLTFNVEKTEFMVYTTYARYLPDILGYTNWERSYERKMR